MGRYANFNTGLEYKFSFGSQSSYDILIFGGVYTQPDIGYIWWDNSNFKTDYKFNIDFEKYEKNLDGTHDLRHELSSTDISDTEILAALIYHQLLYTPILECWFDW